MTERVVAIDHPIGHAHHIPVEPNCFERIIARTTLNMRSVNVVIINLLMSPAPLKIPSATSFVVQQNKMVIIYTET